MNIKKVVTGSMLATAALTVACSAYAATTYGPDTVTVPKNGGNFYSNTHYASGATQYAKINSVSPATSKIYGTINDANHNNISSETPLPVGSNTSIYTGVAANTIVCLMLETSLFDSNSPTVNFQWTP